MTLPPMPVEVPALFVERLGWVLLHSLWQFTLLALLAGSLLRLSQRHSATFRYTLLLMILGAMLLAPAVTFLSLPRESAPPGLAMGSDTPASAFDPALLAGSGLNSGNTQPFAFAPALPLGPGGNPQLENGVQSGDPFSLSGWWSWSMLRLQSWLNVIVGLWCAGVAAFACRPILSWYTVRRLRTIGVVTVSSSIQSLLVRTCLALGLRQTVTVWQSTLVKVPVVVGYFKPVILLPASIVSGLPMSQIEAILAHELAHVRRHDYLINIMQTLIETIFFYHPAIWWVSDCIRTERENCCDDVAVGLVGNRVEYGRALLALEELRGQQTALAMGANGGSLLARVQRLFAPPPIRRQPTMPGGLFVTSLLLLVAIALGIGLRAPQRAWAQNSHPEALPAVADRGTVDNPASDASREVPADIDSSPGAGSSKDTGSGTGRGKAALRPAELPAALQMQFHQWDVSFRHQPEEIFRAFELAAEELIRQTPDRDQQASIYAQVAHIAGQSKINLHASRVQKYTRLALELSRDPLQRAYLHSLQGSAFEVDLTIKDFAERRRQAATRLLDGYAELLAYENPEVAPELPAVGGGDKSEQDPARREAARLKNAAQVAARKQAVYLADLVAQRNILTNQLTWLYQPDPKIHGRTIEGLAEIRELAKNRLPSEAAVTVLMNKIQTARLVPQQPAAASRTAQISVLDKHVAASFERTPLQAALATLCTAVGAELELDSDGLKSSGYTRNMPVTWKQDATPLRSALEQVLKPFQGLSFTRVGNTIFVSTRDVVANRERVAQAAIETARARFAGSWLMTDDGSPNSIDDPPRKLTIYKLDNGESIAVRGTANVWYHIQGATFSRRKDQDAFGGGLLEVDPALSPPTFLMQFKNVSGDAGYIAGTYEFRADETLWLNVAESGFQPPEGSAPAGQPIRQMKLQRMAQAPAARPADKPADAAPSLTPSLELRFVANAPEVEKEPRLPSDYLQRHYRDTLRPAKVGDADVGFAWFPINNPQSSDLHTPIERSVDQQRLGLLSDLPEHALLAGGKWKIVKCEVVAGENGNENFSISVTLDEAGGAAFRRLTKAHLNQQLAIVVGGQIVAAPVVRDEIGAQFMITGKFSKSEAEQVAETILPDDWKQLFDCVVVDASSGKPIEGNDLTIHFRFLKPATPDTPEETIDNVIWGPKSGSQIKFVIPPRVLRHPDFDKLVVRWGVSHPDYATFSSTETISAQQLLRDEPKTSRDALRQIKLTKK